jgi:hypothetical protein
MTPLVVKVNWLIGVGAVSSSAISMSAAHSNRGREFVLMASAADSVTVPPMCAADVIARGALGPPASKGPRDTVV